MKNKLLLLFLLGLLGLNHSCMSDDSWHLSVDIAEGNDIVLGAEMGAAYTFSLSSGQSWTTTVSADWLEVSPKSGEAGDYEVTVSVVKPNDTGEARTAKVTVVSGETPREFEVRQDEFIRVEESSYLLEANGGALNIYFSTPLPQEEIGVFTMKDCDWLTSPPETRAAGEVKEWVVSLYALPNEQSHSRSTTIYFGKLDESQTLSEKNMLATVTITQQGIVTGESTDYSQDGVVNVLQEHTVGAGIPLVLLGDGFMDKEIASGYYAQVMDKTMENLFTEEPIRSLRDYFDIYAVTAVSPTNVFDDNRRTALKCWMEGGNSTLVEGDDNVVLEYLAKVDGLADPYTAQVVVVLNSDAYAGTNYNYWNTNNTPLDYAIAYCPVIGNLENEDFRRVLTHEVAGHGIGKLQDEYSYEEQGAIPAEEIEELQQQQRDFGWWLNVDFTDNREEVLWTNFLYDPRYDGQGLGVFEGACTYWTGAYRPTEESMMRNNIMGFNAPSRRAIYNNVVRRGENRTASLEEFVSFDQQTYVPQTRALSGAPSRPFSRPRVVKLELR